ncbi:MAG: flavodoxin family protein [Catenulispora sp.]
MRALVVYESMYGNTRAVAEAVASGLRPAYETEVKPAVDIGAADVDRADLLVVGGPTHVHGLPRP